MGESCSFVTAGPTAGSRRELAEATGIAWRTVQLVIALEKALGESISEATSAGHSWAEVGWTLGAAESAASFDDVADAYAVSKRAMWERFWTEQTKSA